MKNKPQLFLLHFGGGNCYSYQFLKHHILPYFDFLPLELPGRGKRIQEQLLASDVEAVQDLLSQILSLRNNNPYLIFGHSMGASLGLRVTKKLEDLADPPTRLIVSGNAGPGTEKNDVRRSELTDEAFKNELRALGGVSNEVLNNEELFNFFAPIMRSDFRMLENSEKLSSNFKIRSPLVAVMGDKEESARKIHNWKNFTSNQFRAYLLPGNHFFIYDHPSTLIKIINNQYDRPVVF